MSKKQDFTPFSPKQMKALCWWLPQSPYADRDAIICDGAVRSGKTMCMSVSFVKQHSVVDIYAAIPVCLLAEFITFGKYWKNKIKKK